MMRVRLVLAIGTAALAVLSSGCALAGEPEQPGFSRTVRFERGVPVTQTFVPRVGPLNRFDLLVATYENHAPDAVLRLEINGAGEARTALVGQDDLPDAAWVTFVFPPVSGAAGERFTARITYEGNDPVAYYVNPEDPYPDGALDGGSGDLAFRVGHAGRLRGAVGAAGRSVREFAGRLAADPWFTAVWLLAIAATGAGLAVASTGRTANSDGDVDVRTEH